MTLKREEIDYVAHLSRLALSEGERELFGAQLASILAYVEKLNELDTADVPPTTHVLGLHSVFRDDAERPSTPREAILANAPAQACGCYLVPKVLGD
jgi:aspartyl-tRNA(Asn)/glutamyl-tRNA(Gln) amidotransferase subunit C